MKALTRHMTTQQLQLRRRDIEILFQNPTQPHRSQGIEAITRQGDVLLDVFNGKRKYHRTRGLNSLLGRTVGSSGISSLLDEKVTKRRQMVLRNTNYDETQR